MTLNEEFGRDKGHNEGANSLQNMTGHTISDNTGVNQLG